MWQTEQETFQLQFDQLHVHFRLSAANVDKVVYWEVSTARPSMHADELGNGYSLHIDSGAPEVNCV